MFADYWACPVAELGQAVISLIGSKTREITMKTLTLAAIRCSIIFTAAAALLVVAPLTQAGYIVTLQQAGSNVVATGSGAIDLTGLNFGITLTNGQALIVANEAQIFTGPTSLTSFDLYDGLSGPTDFGSGFVKFADSGSGDLVGIGAFELLSATRVHLWYSSIG